MSHLRFHEIWTEVGLAVADDVVQVEHLVVVVTVRSEVHLTFKMQLMINHPQCKVTVNYDSSNLGGWLAVKPNQKCLY